MDYQPICEQMEEVSPIQGSWNRQIGISRDERERDGKDIISGIHAEIMRLETVLLGIDSDRIPPAGYIALTIAIILNILCLMSSPGTYMVLWILASLYFYLTYPLLPLILILTPYILRRQGEPVKIVRPGPVIPWIQSLHLIRNHKILLQLIIRFFILSIMPLTSGMVLIYSLSLVFALILGVARMIPGQTSLLIVVQCLGILIFYLDLSYLKRQFSFFTQSLVVITNQNWVRYLLMGIVGVLVVIIASCAAIVLLIAILLPGFTLGIYVDVTGFIQNRANLWIVLILISQFIGMQYLQSILSRRIARNLGMDLSCQLKRVQVLLTASGELSVSGNEGRGDPGVSGELQMVRKEAISLLAESRIHAITRTHMAGLFPTYAVGVDVNEIFRIQRLEELSGMFRRE